MNPKCWTAMKQTALAGLTAITMLVVAGASFGQGPFDPGRMLQNTDKVPKSVGLSDEQMKKLKEIDAERAKALAEVQAASQVNGNALQEAAKNNDIDKHTAALVEDHKLSAKYKEISKKFDDSKMAVLTDDQKGKLKDADNTEAQTSAREYYQHMSKEYELSFSDDQINALAAVEIANFAAFDKWHNENKDKLEAIWAAHREAIDSGDFEKAKALEAQAAELPASMRQLHAKSKADTLAIMKDDQRAKWLEREASQNAPLNFLAYRLTDDQKAKIKALCHTLAPEKDATVESIGAKVEQQMFSNILTDEQKAKLLQYRTISRVIYKAAMLTDNQKAKIKDAYVALVANEQTPSIATIKDLKGMDKATDELVTKLKPQIDAMLSNEQKAAVEKFKNATKPATTRPADK